MEFVARLRIRSREPMCTTLFAVFSLLLLLLDEVAPSTPSAIYSGRAVVLFPSNFDSGGPACLHALHTTLNAVGISSEMYAVNPYYDAQHGPHLRPLVDDRTNAAFPSRSEDEIRRTIPGVLESLRRTLTPHDMIILPMMYKDYIAVDTMTELLNNTGGARSVVYLLGVAFPDDPYESAHNVPGLVVGYASESITQGISQILPLSHFIHKFHGLPHAFEKSVLLSPMESIYYERAEMWRELHPNVGQRIAQKQNLVLVDHDLKADLILEPDLLEQYTFVFLNGFSRDELIDLYQRAKVVLDLHFNGPERTVWEGVLFDALPIAALQGNGGDDVDIPIPRTFKIDARYQGARQKAGISAALRHLLSNYDRILAEGHFEKFRRKVENMPKVFAGAVSAAFSTASLHFELGDEGVCGGKFDFYLEKMDWEETLHQEKGQITSLLSILYTMPLARVTIFSRHPLGLVRRWGKVWRELSALGLSDGRGGKPFHSVRVVSRKGSGAECGAYNYNGGDVRVVLPGPGNVLFLGSDTATSIAACLQSKGVDNGRANVDLSVPGTAFFFELSQTHLRGRLNMAQQCAQVGDLSDLLALPPAGEEAAAPTEEQRRVLSEVHASSPLARMSGLFADLLSHSEGL